jgi:RNA exonuclease 1
MSLHESASSTTAPKKVAYDTSVKPAHVTTDYLTRWSGIQPGALDNVIAMLSDVQTDVLKFLVPENKTDQTPILLGHSLELDLKALKICHPRVIDTAVSYGHPRERPFKPGLAWLTRKWLTRDIQNRGEGDMIRMRMLEHVWIFSPRRSQTVSYHPFPLRILSSDTTWLIGPGFREFKTDYESIFTRMSRSTRNMQSFVVDHGTRVKCTGRRRRAARV